MPANCALVNPVWLLQSRSVNLPMFSDQFDSLGTGETTITMDQNLALESKYHGIVWGWNPCTVLCPYTESVLQAKQFSF